MPATTANLRTMVGRILRPLAKFLIRQDIPLNWVVEELKHAYVDEAIRAIEKGNKVTTSRVSLMTGIHRHEVKRLRESSEPKVAKSTPVPNMIAIWKGELIDDSGRPLPLGRVERIAPAGLSFFEVADEATNRDIAPATFLTECIAKKLVHFDEESDTVYLLDEALKPSRDLDEQLYWFELNEGDHLEAGVCNMLETNPRFFDRSVMYEGLVEQDVDALDQLARTLAMDAINEVIREAQKRFNQRQGNFKFNFGAFTFFEEEEKKG